MKVWESTVRRAHSLFSPMSVTPDDDDSPAGRKLYPELLLSNGDFYTGQWSANGVPYGTGKYLWSDGCMYEGQWSADGLPNGQGKFSWPSGAIYEGHFKAGFMDGFGTYTASSGATYRGFWFMNHRHGDGTKSYSNGDFYDGDWLNGLPDGHGRYTWVNGNEYSGQWRTGIIHGIGTFVWAAGECYDGEWEAGRPAGRGTFRQCDDDLSVEVEEEQKGFLVAALKDCKISPAETISILPSQKRFNWSSPVIHPNSNNMVVSDSDRDSSFDPMDGRFGGDEEACCSIGDRRASSVDVEHRGGRKRMQYRFRSIAAVAGKKQGETISKGHKNYELMLNLQLGIRHTVGKQSGQPTSLNLKASAFDPKEKVWTKFPPEGTKHTPPHQSCDFKWKDYCPLVFRTLRNLFKVDAADYMLSICGDDALRELSSPGKSGSFFYLTNDDRYMIKTMKKAEAKADLTDLDNPKRTKESGREVLSLREEIEREAREIGEGSDYEFMDIKGESILKLFNLLYCITISVETDDESSFDLELKMEFFFVLKLSSMACGEASQGVLIRMLPAYYNHVRSFKNTLVTRFFGLHCVKLASPSQKKVRFVIMGNLFCSEYSIHRRFDLKGSSLGRITDKPESEIDETTTLKDLDLNFLFRLQRSWFDEFQWFHAQNLWTRDLQVERDCELLEQERIMDYSLLVGIHFKDSATTGGRHRSLSNLILAPSDPTWSSSVRLGVNLPCRVERTVRRSGCETQLIGEPTGELHDVILFFGIIDILQDYDISKKLEHAYKSFQYDPTSISAVDPIQYAKRFKDFICRVFIEDNIEQR